MSDLIEEGWTDAGKEWLAKGCPPVRANLMWQQYLTEEEKHRLTQSLRSRQDARAIIDSESAFIARLRNTCVQRKCRAEK